MAISVIELRRWAKTLLADSDVAIDEGGLTLVEIPANPKKKPSFGMCEVGGIPLDEDEEDASMEPAPDDTPSLEDRGMNLGSYLS